MSDDFMLHVAGVKYAGWTDMTVTRAIGELAHSFSLRLTDKWAPNQEKIPVKAGDECQIWRGSERVITGYVDEDEKRYNATERSISLSGRSKTGDLVDCSPTRSGKRVLRGVGLMQIATALCRPFGISVSTNVDLGVRFSKFAIEEGETVFAALDRCAKRRGVLLVTDASGNLVFDRAGSRNVTTAIQYGVNVLAGSGRRSMRERFSEYTILCQSSGTDELFGSATSLKRSSTDAFVNRTRPITIMADEEDSGLELQKRANWERNVRAGRARVLTYTVQGWEHENGLWEPNTLARVVDSEQDIDDWLLITSVSQMRGEQGTTTSLTLMAKEAFDIQPLPPPRQKKGSVLS